MSAEVHKIRQSLLELSTCVEIRFAQYALIKHMEKENMEAQMETYKVEVDLLRQENYELKMEKEEEAKRKAEEAERKVDEEMDRMYCPTAYISSTLTVRRHH